MARIPTDELERLKQEVSVQRLAESRGITLKRHGADLIGLCPFHDDHAPSLVISPKKNLWHCLGACQSGGSVIDWVMKAEGVSFRHAVELLQADYDVQGCTNAAGGRKPGAARPLAAGLVKRSTVQKLPTALETDVEDARLLSQVIDYYHATLKQSPEALAYLEQRGLVDSDAIDRFKLGFANRTLGYRLPNKQRREGVAIRGQLQRVGVLRTSGHEHLRGSLVIPVFGEQGQVLEVYGRKITPKLRAGTPLHLYLPGPHQGIFNRDALQASKEIILCESLIDALTFWCAGFRNVTASYGTEGFTKDHLTAFKQYATERVLIAYDRDDAGNKAAEALAKKLTKEGIDAYRIQFPKGMDANEYALQVTPASKSLGVVIRSAVWLGKGKAKPPTSQAVAVESITATTAESALPEPVTEEKPVTPLAAEATKEKPPEAKDSAPLPAAVIPDAPRCPVEAETKSLGTVEERIITLGDRRYRIRGLEKNLSYDLMKVNVLVSRPAFDGPGESVHVDTLDLYQSRPRGAFIKQAAVELGVKDDVIKHDLGKILLTLEALQEAQIKAAQAPKDPAVTLDDDATHAALDLLKSPDLLARIQNDFERCGMVGEATNALVSYLAVISRKLDAPLAITIQSTSAAGKSALMDAVLAFMPGEERIKYSAMTGQSLFYMGETNLKHKVLAIVEEEGASSATYALKLLQSEGELTIASTGKDPATGKLETQEYRVEGPVMILLTTTAIDVDEELLNRCLVLSVDEGRQQTQAIHARQRDKRTLQGLLAKTEKHAIVQQHQNAQRLLQPLAVVNPYARHLTFVDDRTRTRRDHEKYLTLIDTIALLHQYQRDIKTLNPVNPGDPNELAIRYVEVTLDDIAAANRLAHDILGRTLDDLPPQTRRLLRLIVELVETRCTALDLRRSDYRFSRREVREATRWGSTQLKVHLSRLEDMEYLLVHRGGRGQSFVYELLYDGKTAADRPHLSGLIDVDALREKYAYDAKKSGQTANRSGSSRPQVGGMSGSGRGGQNSCKASDGAALSENEDEPAEKGLVRPKRGNGSYRSHNHALSAEAAD